MPVPVDKKSGVRQGGCAHWRTPASQREGREFADAGSAIGVNALDTYS